MKKIKETRFGKTIATTKYCLKYISKIKEGRFLIFLKVFESALSAILTATQIVLPGLLINKLFDQTYDFQFYIYIIGILVIPFIQVIISLLIERAIKKCNQSINIIISTNYFETISSMDYENMENPEIQLLQERAETTLNDITSAIDLLSSLVFALCSLIAIASIISVLNPIFIAVICLVVAINAKSTSRANKKIFSERKELNKMFLLQSVFPFMLTHIEYAKEIRLYDVSSFLINKFASSIRETNKKEMKQLNIRQKLSLLSSILLLIQQIIIYSYLIFLVIFKSLPVGTMTIYLNATSQFSVAIGKVTDAYLKLANKSLYIEDMLYFFGLPQKCRKGTGKPVTFKSGGKIQFNDVSFCYPGSTNYALNHLNLTINYGEKLCIVGENGSGKSTMIKLLCRLYEPTNGSITINGVDINTIEYKEYLKMFSAVFQDFATFSLTLSENIVLSNLCDQLKLDDSTEKVKLSKLIQNLEYGYNTCLDKDIDEHGVRLSGGESQKMAIARALYHNGDVYILDEPTAALDPNAEYELYSLFHDIIKDKTAILVTHRLSAVQLADKVAVFNNGQITEYGTHAKLYANGGKYKEMFDKQAEFYIKAQNE